MFEFIQVFITQTFSNKIDLEICWKQQKPRFASNSLELYGFERKKEAKEILSKNC